MYKESHIKYSCLKLLLVCFVSFTALSCDSLLPDDFDKDKKYNVQEIDDSACSLLSKVITDSTGEIQSSVYIISSKTISSIVDSATQAALAEGSITENQVISSDYDALADSLENYNPFIRDSLMLIEYPVSQEVAYAVFNVSAVESKDIYIYTSLQFKQNNINENVSVRLIKRDTLTVSYSDDMDTETISACSQSVGTKVVPTIKARYKLRVDEGTYLVKFKISNPASVGAFKIIILSS